MDYYKARFRKVNIVVLFVQKVYMLEYPLSISKRPLERWITLVSSGGVDSFLDRNKSTAIL